ncbi:hypothetical protein HYV79_01765 [Candidatus Woesearchaeota archaeon]|nr:hypothetical protein [Candidatus Woesearchaeota archaeon]
MKKISTLIVFLITINIVFASHEVFDKVSSWEDSKLNNWRNDNACNCFNGIESVVKLRNPELDKLGVGKLCTLACTHCESPQSKKIKSNQECTRSCLATGPFRTEQHFSNCFESCIKNYCENTLDLKYTQPIKVQPEKPKEEKLPEVKLPEIAPTPELIKPLELPPQPPEKPPVAEKKEMTPEECNNLAKKTLARLGQQQYCDSQFSLIKFSSEIQKTTELENILDKDILTCSIDSWRQIFESEREKCPNKKPELVDVYKKNIFGLPIMSVVMIILALIIMIVGIGYYIHRKTFHEKEDLGPEELHPRVREAINKKKEEPEEISEEELTPPEEEL